MTNIFDKKSPYELPFIARYKLTKKFFILCIFLILLFFFLFIVLVNEVLAAAIFELLLGLFFLYLVVATSLFKKYYVEITSNFIKVKALFMNKTLPWDDVVGADLNFDNAKNYIGIMTKEKVLRQQYLWTRIIDALHYGPYQLIINLNFLPHIDVERLTLTIRSKITSQNVEGYLEEELMKIEEAEVKEVESPTSNIYKALFYCFLMSIIIGLIYGYVLTILNDSILLLIIGIPIAGYLLIVYIYHRSYDEQSFHIIHRLIIGFICTMPALIGFVSKEYFEVKMAPDNVMIIIRNLSYSMTFRNPTFFIVFLITIYVFIAGTLQGRRLKIQHKLYKLIQLYKKYGNYYCVKQRAFLRIYLIDPEDIDLEFTEFLAVEIENGCLIEKNNKRIEGFYIPNTFIKEANIIVTKEHYVDIDDKKYYYIDLGGYKQSKPKLYHLPCVVFLNENYEICILQLQYFKDR